MSEIEVTATKWDGGWELEIDSDHHTQVRTLDKARQQVIDYLDTTYPEVDHSGWMVAVVPDIPEWDLVMLAREATREASEATVRAAELSRKAVRSLRDRGLSVTDSAAVMGVSRGRVSQLVD